jgi:ABC-2 type transport system permease protein
MRLFWEVARLSFQRQLTYRAATLAGLATNIFFGLLRAALMVALYGARDIVAGISLQDAITYTALTQALIAYLMLFGWYDLMNTVYSGEVATDLLKPFNYFSFWLAQDLGRAVAAMLLRGVPIMVLYAFVVQITMPTTAWQWFVLSFSLLLSWLVSFAWRFLVNLSAFWTPNARGVGRFAFGLVWVLSGFYMPLRYFPDWFQTLCQLTPFPAMVNTSVEIYLGLLAGVALAQALALQALWATVLILACQALLRVGIRSLVIQGG